MRSHSSRVLLFGITGSLGALLLGGATAHADTTTQSAVQSNVDLDANEPGSGTVAQFDPSLGTLTSVSYTIDADVMLQLCAENKSTAAPSSPSGPAQGQLTVTMNGTSAVASSSFVATATLPPSNGTADCEAGFDFATATFPAPVSGADVYYHETTNAGTASGTVTDPAALAAWTGTGTVPFSWTGASNADITLYSEWDIWFIAEGDVHVSVVYTYTPPATTTTSTTTTTLAPTTVPNTVVEVTTTTGAPVTSAATTPPTTPPGGLPSTGSDTAPMLWIATALVAGGFAAWRIGNQRRRPRTDG